MDSSPDLSTWPGLLGAIGTVIAGGIAWWWGKKKMTPGATQITAAASAAVDAAVEAAVQKAIDEKLREQRAEELHHKHEQDLGEIRQDCERALADTRRIVYTRLDDADKRHNSLRELYARLDERVKGLEQRRRA